MSSNQVVAEFLRRNETYAPSHTPSPTIADLTKTVTISPVFIFCCMDARVDPVRILGLQPFEAVVVRNVGGDVTRNIHDMLMFDQLVPVREVLVMQHTDCGVTYLPEDTARAGLKAKVPGHDDEVDGIPFQFFTDVYDQARKNTRFVREHPLLRKELAENTMGVVFDIKTGKVTKVEV
ncbi:carbonic anhydrase [Xylariomycetidae sp. FL0641]|nr:carbonic anhydrase [Xylariomycetidae sp. FL0641]